MKNYFSTRSFIHLSENGLALRCSSTSAYQKSGTIQFYYPGVGLALAEEGPAGFYRKPGQGPHQRFHTALGFKLVKAADGGNGPLPILIVFLPVINDVQVLEPIGFFGSSIYGRHPYSGHPNDTVSAIALDVSNPLRASAVHPMLFFTSMANLSTSRTSPISPLPVTTTPE